jgi:hypothetical protein
MDRRLIDAKMKITAIRYLKESGEFIVAERNADTGKTFKTYSNTLNEDEKFWAKNSKRFFEDKTCACWMN